MNRCCAKCKTPFNCGNQACKCHRTPLLAALIEARAEPKPAPANVTPLFQEPTP